MGTTKFNQTKSDTRPYQDISDRLKERSFFVSILERKRLRDGDLVNQQTNTTLGDDIRYRVSQLNTDDGIGTGDSHHREDINDRVRAPSDDSPPLHALNKFTDGRISFRLGGVIESHEESLDNVEERQHSTNPVDPTTTQIVFAHKEFSRIADCDHGSTSNSQCGGFRF